MKSDRERMDGADYPLLLSVVTALAEAPLDDPLVEAAQRALDGKEPFPSTDDTPTLDPVRQELIEQLSSMTLAEMQQNGANTLGRALKAEEYRNATIVKVTFKIKPGNREWFLGDVERYQRSNGSYILDVEAE